MNSHGWFSSPPVDISIPVLGEELYDLVAQGVFEILRASRRLDRCKGWISATDSGTIEDAFPQALAFVLLACIVRLVLVLLIHMRKLQTLTGRFECYPKRDHITSAQPDLNLVHNVIINWKRSK